LIDLAGKDIFDRALTPEQAALKSLENAAEKAADLKTVGDNVGMTDEMNASLASLKANMGKQLDQEVAAVLNTEVRKSYEQYFKLANQSPPKAAADMAPNEIESKFID